jgi:hypothetical protein
LNIHLVRKKSGAHITNSIGAKVTYQIAGFIETEIAPLGEQLAKYPL